jgi:hypothetical protein
MRAVDTPAKRKPGKRIALAGITGLLVIGAAIAIWVWRVEKSSDPQADVLDKDQAIAVGEADAPSHLAPQHNQLIPERGVFCLKPALRLKWRGQNGQEEAEQ